MEGLSVREIRCEDYHDIYLLNQEFNSERSDFSAEKVKERIQYIIKNTRDIIYTFVFFFIKIFKWVFVKKGCKIFISVV